MPAIINVGSDWVHFANFDAKVMDSIRLRGSTPMWTWQPNDYDLGLAQPKYKLSAIAHGAVDPYIRRFASAAKAWGHVFYLRFAYEMNGNWYSWTTTPGNPDGNTPADFVAAWRHVHDIFASLGVKNVRWVWCANVSYPGSTPDILDYPGDAYVDWVALDGYNWGNSPGHSWQSLYQVFGASYAEVTAFTRRPLMIAETGSVEQGGSKAAWILQGFLHELPNLMPRVRAVLWFEAKAKGDWRVYTSSSALKAFRTVVASPLFGGKPVPPTPVARHG
jgi:beta-mannanase